tara:strand:+ start:1625 stop:2026 length:402 start_codon:yes stop_codon:yes gene_type:complete
MKLEIKTNFSFPKLSSKISKIIEKHSQRTARSSAEGARENIEKGVSPPLKQETINARKRRGTGGSKPLFETGSLFRSIKGTSDGLRMNEYGLYHHKGHSKGHFPARPFITPSKKTILKSEKALKKEIDKALKK